MVLRTLPVAVLCLGLGVLPAAAAAETQEAPRDVLTRLGLLGAPAPAPVKQQVKAPAKPQAARVTESPGTPRETLQRLGLLAADPTEPTTGQVGPIESATVEPATVQEDPPAAQAATELATTATPPAPAPQAPAQAPASEAGQSLAAAAPEAPAAAASTLLPRGAVNLLQRMGIMAADPVPAVAPAPAPAPMPESEPQPVSQAAAPVTTASALPAGLSRAYDLLRNKGLLPGGEAKPATASRAARRQHPGAERVLVDKSERKLFLIKGGRPYREYRISLGGMPNGPKVRAGDLRTPEGVYTLDWRNPRSRFYKSIHISYPNEQDRVRAAELGVDPGGNIMIHGEHYVPAVQRTLRRAKSPKDWTEGCIALNNEQIDEIWTEVADGTTIEIRP